MTNEEILFECQRLQEELISTAATMELKPTTMVEIKNKIDNLQAICPHEKINENNICIYCGKEVIK